MGAGKHSLFVGVWFARVTLVSRVLTFLEHVVGLTLHLWQHLRMVSLYQKAVPIS